MAENEQLIADIMGAPGRLRSLFAGNRAGPGVEPVAPGATTLPVTAAEALPAQPELRQEGSGQA